MEVRLLGPIEVRLDDRAIELGPRKQRAVLAMLALELGRTVSADRIAEAADEWAAADRHLTDLAAAVPMTNRRAVALVSERVGNVTYHSMWSTLLDQIWVR